MGEEGRKERKKEDRRESKRCSPTNSVVVVGSGGGE